jgi:hypothetical protein
MQSAVISWSIKKEKYEGMLGVTRKKERWWG